MSLGALILLPQAESKSPPLGLSLRALLHDFQGWEIRYNTAPFYLVFMSYVYSVVSNSL